MTENEAKEQLELILRTLNVSQGDTVYLGVNMAALPLPAYPAKVNAKAMRERADKWCEFVLNVLLEYLGDEGTLIVPTFSYNFAAPGTTFDHQKTPSDVGPFTEHVRRHPNAVRSLHPIFSLAGIGKHAKDILGNVSKSAFGPLSGFGQLPKYNVRFVCLGVPFSRSITYLHLLEQVNGCNHRYHKILECKVMSNGAEVKGPWLAYLSFRGTAQDAECLSVENRLRDKGVLLDANYRNRPFQSVRLADVDVTGLQMLNENPCAFASYDVEVRLDETATAANPSTDSLAEFVLSHKQPAKT